MKETKTNPPYPDFNKLERWLVERFGNDESLRMKVTLDGGGAGTIIDMEVTVNTASGKSANDRLRFEDWQLQPTFARCSCAGRYELGYRIIYKPISHEERAEQAGIMTYRTAERALPCLLSAKHKDWSVLSVTDDTVREPNCPTTRTLTINLGKSRS